MNLTKIVKIESQEDYESTVPSTVRLANEEKVRSSLKLIPIMSLTAICYFQRKTLEADIQLLEHSIDMFTQMK